MQKIAVNHRCWAFLATVLILGFAAAAEQTVQKTKQLIDLNEDNWRLMLQGEWMVEFYAPWCPACKNLAPTWERFASTAAEINVNVAKIDVTTSPSLSGRFFVTALPTIYHVKEGEFRQYRGSRDGDALMFFVKQKQWSKLEPISAWKKPDTIHMSVLSYFFKLSHTLKDFNGRLQEEYGLPTWGSYALFAIGTIFVGAALGLMLVCVVDFLYPPKKHQRQSFSESKENGQNQNGIEDINDELEDDAPEDEDANADDQEEEEEEEEEDNNDDEEENEENERSSTEDEEEDEKQQSESEEPESEKKPQTPAKKEAEEKPSPTEVRKRKPRKAD
ncbi:thioredoxin-related transmembrane protein 1 isoform X2 [Stomoxys calcitrans]|uniref:Thioredoxin-related transmembrane protein 1 n=1 Tax=Stomoxys calcitrans TaxID=35570 RepID=A0A1I8PM99_STOCA|nr:thioredoxin-related transmembrane protein 1 isoform X2 [Stomoxys calcitrans]